MNRSDALHILSAIGSICSIIALLLTLSGNLALRNIVQIAFGVIAIVGVGGIIYKVARFYWESYVNIDFWALKLLYWLCVLIVGAFIVCYAGIGVYFILDLLLDMGKSALKCIYQ